MHQPRSCWVCADVWEWSMKVLIVSDDPVFARLATKKFESWGHRPRVAVTGTEAYELIRQQPFRFVITGSDVPGLSGPELCRKIRELKRTRYTYVIIYENQNKAVLQAGAERLGLMAGLQAGADDYLTLPLNPLELRLRVKNAKRMLNLEDELRDGPGMDATTGVANYASFREFFRLMLAASIRTNQRGALMYVRIDSYHEAYAEHGYETTQRMMSEMASVLKRSARACDLVARYADDEFCIMLHDTHWDKCTPLAERIISNAESVSIVVDDDTLYPKISISAMNFPIEDLSADDILALPDRIPYAA